MYNKTMHTSEVGCKNKITHVSYYIKSFTDGLHNVTKIPYQHAKFCFIKISKNNYSLKLTYSSH